MSPREVVVTIDRVVVDAALGLDPRGLHAALTEAITAELGSAAGASSVHLDRVAPPPTGGSVGQVAGAVARVIGATSGGARHE